MGVNLLRTKKRKKISEEQFEQLIKKYEEEEKANPRGFKKRIIKMLILGYSYFFLITLVLLAVLYFLIRYIVPYFASFILPVVLIILVCTLVVFGFSVAAILKSIFIRFEKPEGIQIREKDAPLLFELINKYSKELKSSKVHKVYLNNDMNAMVYQRPRMGIFGVFSNYIVIGMPIFLLLSKSQFESVLAHEIGHLSKSHGKLSGLIYRIREPWIKLIDAYEMHELFLYEKFYNWYFPRLNAMTFVISRVFEYEADIKAIELTSPEGLLDSLALIDMLDEYMKESFWEDYYRNSIKHEKPISVFGEMEKFYKKTMPRERYSQLFQQVLNIKTDYYDTHPSYSDRAKGLSFTPKLPDIPEVSAACVMFGDSINNYIEHLEEMWMDEVKVTWEFEREERLEMIKKLAEINEALKTRPLTEVEASDRAFWCEKIYGIKKAYPMYKDVLNKNSFNPVANFFIGRKLILSGDPRGVELINNAVQRDLDAVIPGTELICNYLFREGKTEEADKYFKDQGYRVNLYYKLEYYRNSISYYDTLITPDLPVDMIERLKRKLQEIPILQEAYLLRKEVRDADIKEPIHILFIRVKKRGFVNKKMYEVVLRRLRRIVSKNTMVFDMKFIKSKEFMKLVRSFEDQRII